MTLHMCISKGNAVIASEGLRCGAPRKSNPDQRCNKLLCKKPATGLISGNFCCERCKQEIEVVLREARPAA